MTWTSTGESKKCSHVVSLGGDSRWRPVTGAAREPLSGSLRESTPPEDAEALRGIVFLADRKFLGGPDEGVLYFEDFEGCDIADEEGSLLGRVVDMFGAGGNDVIVIRAPGGEELLMPATREVVLRREDGRWIFRPPKLDVED